MSIRFGLAWSPFNVFLTPSTLGRSHDLQPVTSAEWPSQARIQHPSNTKWMSGESHTWSSAFGGAEPWGKGFWEGSPAVRWTQWQVKGREKSWTSVHFMEIRVSRSACSAMQLDNRHSVITGGAYRLLVEFNPGFKSFHRQSGKLWQAATREVLTEALPHSRQRIWGAELLRLVRSGDEGMRAHQKSTGAWPKSVTEKKW